jgi:hypothetical protein
VKVHFLKPRCHSGFFFFELSYLGVMDFGVETCKHSGMDLVEVEAKYL